MKKILRYAIPAVFLGVGITLSSVAAEQTKNLDATPQAKMYMTQAKAVQAGDYEAYKKTMTKASAAGMEKQTKEMNMDSKKAMEFMKAMLPSDIHFTSLKVDGKKATMLATGKMQGEVNRGTIEYEQEDGQWKIVQQSWTNAK
jgi:hypothetical protein